MATQFNANADLEQIRTSLSSYRDLVKDLGSDLYTPVPEVSEWCIAQHMYHVVLATDLGLGNVLSLVREKGMQVRAEGELGEYALEVLSAPSSPRGVTKAPRMVQPGNSVDAQMIQTEFENLDRSLHALQDPPRPFEDCPGWISHQVLGTLDASHWMRFCKLHASHHLSIMQDIATALAGR